MRRNPAQARFVRSGSSRARVARRCCPRASPPRPGVARARRTRRPRPRPPRRSRDRDRSARRRPSSRSCSPGAPSRTMWKTLIVPVIVSPSRIAKGCVRRRAAARGARAGPRSEELRRGTARTARGSRGSRRRARPAPRRLPAGRQITGAASRRGGKRSRIQRRRAARAGGAAVDADEVARARVHRQASLDREVAVVPLDQLVRRVEAPAAASSPVPPRTRPDRDLLGERPPGLPEPALMLVDLVLDLAQPTHPDRRPVERPRPDRGRDGSSAAATAAARRASGSSRDPPRAPPVPSVRGRLRRARQISFNVLGSIAGEGTVLPNGGDRGPDQGRRARRRAAKRGAGSRSRRSASTPTPR